MEDFRFRQIHLDFHTSQYIPEVGADFNKEYFVKTLKSAYVNSITCFARCHHGYLYYPSQLHPDKIHPNLKNKNLLVEQIDACHQNDIKVPIYTTVQWDALIAKEHPEWLAVDAQGNYINNQNVEEPHFYNILCLNSGYRNYFKNHLQDIINTIGPKKIDGFFMDILFRVACNCNHCRQEMKENDFNPDLKSERIAYSLLMLSEFRQEITALIKEKVPDASIFYNSSHVGPVLKNNLEQYTHLEIESLPSGGWGYMHFPAVVRYAQNFDKDLIGMTGKFHTYWGDFHSFKNKAALEFECFQMLAFNAGCSIGDQLEPAGSLSQGTYKLIADVYQQVEKKEDYCVNTEAIVEIGVLTPEEFYQEEHSLGLPESLLGTIRILQELSYQFEIIDSELDFSKYNLLILPDQIEYSQILEKKLRDYLKNGGKIVASYHSILDLRGSNSELFGIKYKQESEYYRDFILPNQVLGKSLNKEEHVMYLRGAEIEEIDAEVLMSTIKPFFNREGDKFCSHQHTPSSGEKGYPAVVRKNNAIFLAHPIFKIYAKNSPHWCKIILKDILDILLPDKLITHNGPSTLITTFNSQLSKKRDIIHLLHYIPEKRSKDIYTIEDIIPLTKIKFKIYIGSKSLKNLNLLFTENDIEYQNKGNYLYFEIDNIEGHEMISLDYN